MDCEVQFYVGIEGFLQTISMRKQVFEFEQGFLEGQDDYDCESFHVVIYENDVAIASGRMYLEQPSVYHLGRIVVMPHRRGYGYGKMVVNQLVQHASNLQAHQCVLSSQLQACDFYQKLGFVKSGNVYQEQGQPHQWMIKTIKKAEV